MSFSMSHTITLAHPISVVFPTLSDPQRLERLQRLSAEAQHFLLLPSDSVRLPPGGLAPLIPAANHPQNANNLPRPKTMDKCEGSEGDGNDSQAAGRLVQRTWFEFGGTVPLVFGLINRPLKVAGAQVVDQDARIVLFESGVEASGIKEIKVRTFEEVELAEGKKGTRVKETVWGTCPWFLSKILMFIAPKSLRDHMELYHTLFEE